MAEAGERPFLGVERSVTGRLWRERLGVRERATAEAIAQQSDVGVIVARVLAGRGVRPAEVAAYLEPSLRALMPDPSTITDMDAAAARLAAAVTAGESVAVFGDYDVDGAASAALLQRFLGHYGVECAVRIPDRVIEGYGPTPAAMTELIEAGARLVVTVDCGVAGHEAIATARELGADVIVLDHHQAPATLPEASAIVDPNRHDDLSGLGHLCAAGVTFMALVATARLLRGQGLDSPDLIGWLDLVALATVADVVPLRGLNRAFVSRGLEVLRTGRNPGLAALAASAKLTGPAGAYSLGFVLGPRINAGGRIGDAALGARLLATDDPLEAEEIAARLERLNAERRRQERAMVEEAVAEAQAEIGAGSGPSVLVTQSDHWHPGLVGLIASRLRERFERPAVAIHFDAGGRGHGSARSVPGVDIGRLVSAAVEEGILAKGGGHAMAAGLTVAREALPRLRGFLESSVGAGTAIQPRELVIDAALGAAAATPQLAAQIERCGPFGSGNPAPLLALPLHTLEGKRTVGREHLAFTLRGSDGSRLQAIAFSPEPALGALLDMPSGRVHVVGHLERDFYRGRERAQLRVLDAALAETGGRIA